MNHDHPVMPSTLKTREELEQQRAAAERDRRACLKRLHGETSRVAGYTPVGWDEGERSPK